MRQLATIMTGVFLVAALASCGDKDQAGGDDKSSAAESSSSAGSGDDGSPSQSESDGEDPGSDAKTLTGTVSKGTEPGCLMLKSDGEKYQLVGDKAGKLKSGMKVEVTGKISDEAMTTCMEGRVFEVDSVKTL